MRILTFNHHESYLCSLAWTGHSFDVVTRRGTLDLSWNIRARPVPPNFRLVAFEDPEVQHLLASGGYDVVICHTIKNLLWLFFFRRTRYIFIAHIPLFFYTPALALKSLCKKALWLLFRATHQARFFAVSRFKLESWGVDGSFAVLTPEAFPPLQPIATAPKVVVVGNDLGSRRDEMGLDMIERIRERVPVLTLGNSPGLAHNITPANFDDFQRLVTECHIYLYTIRRPWGDGYNTAMLEAMRMGMAIVTVDNPSSPILHNQNGLVGATTEELIEHLEYLRARPEEIRRLGTAGQATIERQFNPDLFRAAWKRLLSDSSTRE
jgi:hypothetical protein